MSTQQTHFSIFHMYFRKYFMSNKHKVYESGTMKCQDWKWRIRFQVGWDYTQPPPRIKHESCSKSSAKTLPHYFFKKNNWSYFSGFKEPPPKAFLISLLTGPCVSPSILRNLSSSRLKGYPLHFWVLLDNFGAHVCISIRN